MISELTVAVSAQQVCRFNDAQQSLKVLHEPWTVTFCKPSAWAEALGCTELALLKAVTAVGSSAEKVREYLRKR